MADKDNEEDEPDEPTLEELRERAIIDEERYRTISVGNNGTYRRP